MKNETVSLEKYSTLAESYAELEKKFAQTAELRISRLKDKQLILTLQADYDKLKEAFEELLEKFTDHVYDGVNSKECWRNKAGLK